MTLILVLNMVIFFTVIHHLAFLLLNHSDDSENEIIPPTPPNKKLKLSYVFQQQPPSPAHSELSALLDLNPPSPYSVDISSDDETDIIPPIPKKSCPKFDSKLPVSVINTPSSFSAINSPSPCSPNSISAHDSISVLTHASPSECSLSTSPQSISNLLQNDTLLSQIPLGTVQQSYPYSLDSGLPDSHS